MNEIEEIINYCDYNINELRDRLQLRKSDKQYLDYNYIRLGKLKIIKAFLLNWKNKKQQEIK